MTTSAQIPVERLRSILTFVQAAERLKDTLRSGVTAQGRQESTAEHCWRLCLLVCLFENELDDADVLRVLKLCLIHDVGEAISGDSPAPAQREEDDRRARERADMKQLCAALPADLRSDMLSLWDEYADGATPEAVLAKGFDKIETMLQHLVGRQPADFDYAFNLTYGTANTGGHPLLRQLRTEVDKETRSRITP
jgi:putative hydrolase of HD superfamily